MTAEFLQKERQKMMIAQLAGGRCRDLKRDKNIKIDIKNGNIYISTCRREMQGSMSARFPPNRHSHTPSISTSQVRLSYILALHIINILYFIYYKSYIIFPPNRHSHTPSISTLQVRLSYKHHTLLQPGLLYTSKIISIISQRTMVYVRLTTCRKHNNDIDHDISDLLIISP